MRGGGRIPEPAVAPWRVPLHHLAMDGRVDGLYPDVRPIFVLGSYSSGTTILCDAIRRGAGIPGYGEGWLHPVAYTLINRLPEMWHELGFHNDPEPDS